MIQQTKLKIKLNKLFYGFKRITKIIEISLIIF